MGAGFETECYDHGKENGSDVDKCLHASERKLMPPKAYL
jgi:hypothetical protein